MAIRLAICDDNMTFSAMLRMVLGIEPDIEVVGEALNGRQAVDLVAREQPDVLLLDVAMPIMDGIEALPLVLKASPGTSVVMLSGFSSHAIREQATAAGAVRFVEKGSDIGVVLEAVRAAVGVA